MNKLQTDSFITFKELKEIAKKYGIVGSNVLIGKWAKDKGYIKTIRCIDRIRTVVYYK